MGLLRIDVETGSYTDHLNHIFTVFDRSDVGEALYIACIAITFGSVGRILNICWQKFACLVGLQ